MSDKFQDGCQVWDNLILLLYPIDETITDEEVDEELIRFGIDIEPAIARLHTMMEGYHARARLGKAKVIRETIGKRVNNIVAPHIENLRDGVKELIGKTVIGEEQLVYFHKLEGAASEDDLQSLMDDLEKLAMIREFGNDTQSE